MSNPYGITLLGEAFSDPKTLLRLHRLLEWAGVDRNRFDVRAIPQSHPQGGWDFGPSTSVVVPLGNAGLDAILGKQNILTNRGYLWPGQGYHIIPTVDPVFIQKGNAKWSAAFINDIQKAVDIAEKGLPPQLVDYTLDPLPYVALDWAREYLRALAADPSIYLAFDIETPGKGEDEEDIDTDSDAPDRTWHIDRIGFSYKPYHALSIPWEPPYLAAIRSLLEGSGAKVVWNAGFDVPRIRRSGIGIEGTIHDGMVAWHILHSDLPKRLGFVATFTCPYQPAWKHLSGARPAFYNATDADVELRSMIKIEEELRKTDLWEVYERDVVELDPILIHMHRAGMPVDHAIRIDRAIRLRDELVKVKSDLEQSVPLEARRIDHIFKKTPKDTNGLYSRPAHRLVPTCSMCGIESPRRDHFKRFVKKHNPCCDGTVEEVKKVVDEYYRLSEWSPSRDQMVRYHNFMRRGCPTVWDKKAMKRKISFGERQIKDLQGKFPLDPLYRLVLQYREIDKLASTYVGRPAE